MKNFNLQEAIKFTGVSEKTFNRFLSAGYFAPYVVDGEQFFSAEEIAKVFGISLPAEQEQEIHHEEPKKVEKKPDLIFPEVNNSANLLSEIDRLKNLISLQEQLLDMKEKEVIDLREQRTWLQERILKMEEKSERDQLLLISETQMLTKIIANQTRKSTWQKALGWLGLEEDNNTVMHKN